MNKIRPFHRHTESRFTRYRGNVITTYFNMTRGAVKRFMRTNGYKVDKEMRDSINSKKKGVTLYRGYLGVKYIDYNCKNKRLYVIRGTW